MGTSHKKLLILSLPLILCAISCLAFWGVEVSVIRTKSTIMETLLGRLKSDLTDSVDSIVAKGDQLATIIAENSSMDEVRITALAEDILKEVPCIKGIAIAPDAIVQHYFPLPGNENLIGHDLLTNPERRESLALAVESRKPTVSGPFSSVDGTVFFIRYPVFQHEKLWGFMSMTVLFDEFQKAIGLEQKYSGLQISITRSNGPFQSQSSQLQMFGETWALTIQISDTPALFSIALVVLFALSLSASAQLFIILRQNNKIPQVTHGKPTPSTDQKDSAVPTAHTQATIPAQKSEHPTQHNSRNTEPSKAKTAPRIKREKVEFLGPDVPGQLFMPELLVEGNPAHVFATYVEKKTEPAHEPENLQGLEKPAETVISFINKEIKSEFPQITINHGNETVQLKPVELDFRKEQGRPREEIPISTHDIRILVVDDSEANRDIMGRMLSLRKYNAKFASSGSEALALCSSTRFDVIFMDCFMPDMDGYKTARALREQKLAEHSFIIGMSAKVGQQELDLCIESGMDDLLPKPFTISELDLHIRKRLS